MYSNWKSVPGKNWRFWQMHQSFSYWWPSTVSWNVITQQHTWYSLPFSWSSIASVSGPTSNFDGSYTRNMMSARSMNHWQASLNGNRRSTCLRISRMPGISTIFTLLESRETKVYHMLLVSNGKCWFQTTIEIQFWKLTVLKSVAHTCICGK